MARILTNNDFTSSLRPYLRLSIPTDVRTCIYNHEQSLRHHELRQSLLYNQYLHPTIVTALRHDPSFHIEGRKNVLKKQNIGSWGWSWDSTPRRKENLLLFGTHPPTYQTSLCKTTRLL